MIQQITAFYKDLDFTIWAATLASWLTLVIGICILSYLSNLIAKRCIVTLIHHWIEKNGSRFGAGLIKHQVFLRLSRMIPAIIIYHFVPWIIVDDRPFTLTLEHLIHAGTKIYMIIIMTVALTAICNVIEEYYQQASAIKQRPIKSYLEVAKILIYIIAGILIGSTIFDKSPAALLTGLGAAAAVLTVVFREPILSLIASVQIGTYDLVRLGDRIEVPAYGADGEVRDISLNTIKVQNGDKTIVTIPTYALVNTQMKNWRGMIDAGGRRIKRALNIDMHSIRFCSNELLNKLKQVEHLKQYLITKNEEIEKYNNNLPIPISECPVNGRCLTNIGIFRAYLEAYLISHPNLNQNMLSYVSQLAPTAEGLPIEIHVFTRQLAVNEYEAVAADIFDHILAIIPFFELRVFQHATSD